MMGGLAFEDTAGEELQFMPGDRSRMTLTSEGILWMAEHSPHLLPDISRKHIEDKSKSGGLGKFLTCWQAIYFCAHCVFRLSRRYSISFLELNVFAHALCAMILFYSWWNKPQDTLEPTLITDQNGLDVCALFCLRSQKPSTSSFEWDSPAGYRSRSIPCEPSKDFWEINMPTSVTTYYRRDSQSTSVGENNRGPLRLSFGPDRQPCLKVLDTFWEIVTSKQDWREGSICSFDSRNIRRLARAYSLTQVRGQNTGIDSMLKDRCADFAWGQLAHLPDKMKYSGYTSGTLLFSSRAQRIYAGLTLAGCCYGGLHLTAWACQFPSNAETMLWRAASVTILATGPIIIVVPYTNIVHMYMQVYGMGGSLDLWRFDPSQWTASPASPVKLVVKVKKVAGLTLFFLWVIWYLLCRAFIVVECFIMLAHLPDTTLEIPRWATYIPHIT
jgi:hypothetical protein